MVVISSLVSLTLLNDMSITNEPNNEANRICLLLARRSRHVEVGSVIKMLFSTLFSGTHLQDENQYLYSVVGTQYDYCHFISASASAYQVNFTLDDFEIPSNILPLLNHPYFENDMIILRFPEQNASLDDPNIDRLCVEINGH